MSSVHLEAATSLAGSLSIANSLASAGLALHFHFIHSTLSYHQVFLTIVNLAFEHTKGVPLD